MSRRWAASHAPDPEPDFLILEFGARTSRERPMPGCSALCCWRGPWTEAAVPRLLLDRLAWTTSGADLAPIVGALVGWLAGVVALVRLLGGAW